MTVCFDSSSHFSCGFDPHLLDFAEYTSAQTRIALGKKAKKVEASRLREEMQDLIADAFVSLSLPLDRLGAHSY
jgi:Nineteen complex-related protein 2